MVTRWPDLTYVSGLWQIQVGICRTMNSWLIYAPVVFLVRTSPIQKPIHLLISKQFFTGTTVIGTSTLQTLISPCQKYRMPDSKKLEILIYPQKFCYTGYEISTNYPLFLKTKLDKKQYQFLSPTVELAKLSMRKDYVSLTLIKSKIN